MLNTCFLPFKVRAQFSRSVTIAHLSHFFLSFKGGSAHAGTLNSYAGTYKKERTQRIGGYAGVSVAEASANFSIFGASASTLSANAHYEVGLNNSIGASASLARAEAHAGPLAVGVGLSLDTGLIFQITLP